MSVFVAVSFAARLAALGWSLVLLRQARDWRYAFVGGLTALLLFCQVVRFGLPDALGPWSFDFAFPEARALTISLLLLAMVCSLQTIIRERNRVEGALRESERRFQELIDCTVDHCWKLDPAFRFTWDPGHVNAEPDMPDTIGRTRWELAGADPETSAPWRRHRADLEAHRPFRDFRYSYRTPGGRTLHWRVSGQPVFGPDGAFQGYIGTSVDETQQVEARGAAEAALCRSEQQFHDLFDNAPVMFVSVEAASGKVVACNNMAAAKLGFEKSEIIGRDVFELYHADCRDAATLAFDHFVETGEVRDRHLKLQCKDGNDIDVLLSVSAVRDETGKVIQSRSVWQDVTERNQARAALRATEMRFRDFATIASDWFWETDSELRFTFVSPSFEENTGLRISDYMGRSVAGIRKTALDPSAAAGHLKDLRARRPFRNFVYGRKMNDGRTIFFRISGQPLLDSTSQFLGYRGVASNITAEVEAVKHRHLADARLTRAVEAVPAAFALFDENDALVMCNRVYREGYQTSGAPIEPGVTFESLVRAFAESGGIEGGERKAKAWVRHRLGRRKSPARDFAYRRSDGRWIETTDYILNSGSIITVGVDVTERWEAETACQQHQSELAQVLRRSSMDQMAAVIAHELNQPLTAIVNYARGSLRRLDAGRLDPEELHDVLGRLCSEASRATEVLRRVGCFVGGSKRQPEPIQVAALFRTITLLLEHELHNKKIYLTADLEAADLMVHGDRVELEQVLLNLVKNSVDSLSGHPRKDKVVSLHAQASDGGHVEIMVSDNGPGFARGPKDRPFDPFFTTKEEGMGMGLAIVKAIVEAHDGTIEINEQSPVGAALRLRLPSCQEVMNHAA